MNALNNLIERCHERHEKPLRQRKTVVMPALYNNKGYPYHITVYCAQRYRVLLADLEQANVSFMPIGRAPNNDHGPGNFGGKRFLSPQKAQDWGVRRWHTSWGIQVYTGIPSARDGAQWHDIEFIVDPENKFTFSEIYVIVSDYGIFNRFTQTRP